MSKRTLSARLAPVALIVFPWLNFGLVHRIENLPLATLLMTIAYLLGIFVFKSVASAAREGSITLTLGAAVLGGLIGGISCQPEQIWMMTVIWSAMILTGWLVGRRARSEPSGLRLYLWGTAVILVGGLIVLAPQWPELMRVAALASQDMVAKIENVMVTGGYNVDAARIYGEQVQSGMNLAIRLMPAATIMNLVLQFSLGFLWFLGRPRPGENTLSVRPFTAWKVPFALMPVLLAVVPARLFGGPTLALAADNILLVLSIYYCVGGLALMEHFLHRLKMATGMKILFYIMMVITGLLGYLITVVIGFLDSFADWRRLSTGVAIDLKK